jgi:RNA polymerase sigma-70 factor (ECF subfamily)
MGSEVARAEFDAAAREHAPRLLALARLLLGERHEAEDVVQEAFLRTWERWDDPDVRDHALPWLLRVVRNRCIDLRRVHAPVLGLDRDAPAPAAIDEQGARLWSLDQVTAAVRRLPEPHASILLLRFSQKLSYEEIARVMEVPLGTAKSQLSRALALLRAELGGGSP